MVSSNGIEMGSQTDMLRLDALIMTVQLNLRKLLEVTRPLSLGRPQARQRAPATRPSAPSTTVQVSPRRQLEMTV